MNGNARLLFGACFLIVIAIALIAIHDARAASGVAASCANANFNNGLGARAWYFGLGQTAGTSCSTSTDALGEVSAGASFVLKCRESAPPTGGTPAANTLTVELYKDGQNFNAPTAAPVWSATASGASCVTEQSWTVYCTSDGTVGGTAQHGTLRLVVHAVNTGTGTSYDVNSDGDSLSYGIIHCDPHLALVSDGNPLSPPVKYIGGDTLRSSIQATSSPYTGVNNLQLSLVCGTSVNTISGLGLSASVTSIDSTLKGAPGTYPDACTLAQRLTITATSTISGLTSIPLFTWDSSHPLTGVTYTTNVQADRSTGVILSRVGSATGCAASPDRPMRGDSTTITCTLLDPRGNAVPSLTLAQGWTQRSTQSAYDATDFATVTFTVGANGALSYAATAKTCSPAPCSTGATDTNTTQAYDYLSEIRTWGASRTDTELYNWLNTSTVLDVSTSFSFPVNTWKNTCSGAQTSVFIIASDLIAQTEGSVHDAKGNTVTRSLSFSRTYTEPNSGTTIAPDSQSGVTTGTSACHALQPTSPAAATWQFSATVTDANGNSGTTTNTLTFLSPYTSPYALTVLGAAVPTAPGRTMTLQLLPQKRNDATGILDSICPDQAPAYRVNYTDAAGAWQVLQPTTTATPTGATNCAYWANVTFPASWPAGRPAVFIAAANISGLYIPARADLLVEAPTGRDPPRLTVHDIDVGGVENITVQLTYDNGTARTGAATNVSVWAINTDTGALALNAAHPTELTLSGATFGYYYLAFSPAQGNYTVLLNLTTDQNEARSAPAAQFRVAGPRATQGDLLQVQTTLMLNQNATTLPLATEADLLRVLGVVLQLDANATARFQAVLAGENSTTAPLALEADVQKALGIVNLLDANATARFQATLAQINTTTAPLALSSDLQKVLGVVGPLDANATARFSAVLSGENATQGIVAPLDANATARFNALLAVVGPLDANATARFNAVLANQNTTTAPLATQGTLLQLWGRENLSLALADFLAWRDGEGRPIAARANATLALSDFLAWIHGENEPANNRANLTLQFTDFQAWRDGEGRPIAARTNLSLALADFLAWRDGEARPSSTRINATLPLADFLNWRDGEARPASARVNLTDQDVNTVLAQLAAHDASEAARLSILPALWNRSNLTELGADANASFAQILANLTGVNSTASGAFSKADYNAFLYGAFLPSWTTLNATAREATLTLARDLVLASTADNATRLNATLNQTRADLASLAGTEATTLGELRDHATSTATNHAATLKRFDALDSGIHIPPDQAPTLYVAGFATLASIIILAAFLGGRRSTR